MANYDYDFFVIGGGSGGVRAARVVASMGKRVGIAEERRFGGTCVIRGCVPKKLFVYASQFPQNFGDARGYGWEVPTPQFDWKTLVHNKDHEIARLEALYRKGVEDAGGDIFSSRAVLIDRHTIRLEQENRTVTADQILIATGGRPNPHAALPGHEHCIFSDEAFDLPELPKSIVISGGGYIAVEFACIFRGLGVETTLVYRGKEILQRFDHDLRRGLHASMEQNGIRVLCHTVLENVEKLDDGRLAARTNEGETLIADQVMLAIGRTPNTENLGLETAAVQTGKIDEIFIDTFCRTSVDNIWAIGDVTGKTQLTPVAIHEAMCVVATAFENRPTEPDRGCIPTAVFSQPELGTVGLSEEVAADRFRNLEVYKSTFRPMRQTLTDRRETMVMKLIVDSSTGVVVGAHIMGPDAAEMVQLLAIPVKAGLTKDDFDRTMALHPTAAEEVVTLYKPSYWVVDGVRMN